MKRFLFLTVTLIIAIAVQSQPYSWSTKAEGQWSDENTWIKPVGAPAGQTFPETANDNVTINHDVTLDAAANNPTVQYVTVAFLSANARLNMGQQTLSTVGDFTTTGPGPGFSDLTIQGGTLNVGVTNISSRLFVKNGSITISASSTINVGGFMKLTGGTLSFSDQITFNICQAGLRNDNTENNLFVGQSVTMTGAVNTDLDIYIENGNQGSKAEVFLETFTRNIGQGGTFTTTLQNNSGSTDYLIRTDKDLRRIISDFGGDDTLYIERITGFDTLRIQKLTLNSGSFALPQDLSLQVLTDFESNTSKDLRVDGELTVDGTLSLNGNPNSIDGGGVVQATTYVYGTTSKEPKEPADPSSTIYGIQPANGERSAGGNWFGSDDDDWFNRNNWNRLPSRSTHVIIDSDFNLGNWPVVNSSVVSAEARSVEVYGNGAALQVASNSELDIQSQGNSGKHGNMVVDQSANCVVNGGILSLDTDLEVENGATVTVNNGGSVNIDGNADINPGGSLSVSGNNSTITVGGPSK